MNNTISRAPHQAGLPNNQRRSTIGCKSLDVSHSVRTVLFIYLLIYLLPVQRISCDNLIKYQIRMLKSATEEPDVGVSSWWTIGVI